MKFATGGNSSPHIGISTDVGAMMRQVLLALVPGIAVSCYFFGFGVLSNLLLASVFAAVFEALALRLRGRSASTALGDYSIFVSAWLLALALPPFSPWWLLLIASGCATALGKHLYGGLGYNPFNPAMVGYVVALISFPRELSLWPAVHADFIWDLGASLRLVWLQSLSEHANWDVITQATPLSGVKTALAQGQDMATIMSSPSFAGYASGMYLGLAWLGGGVWLLYRRIISWHIPAGLLISIGLIAALAYGYDAQRYPGPLFHLLSGATILGAFFIATDPVSAPSSNLGRLLFGVLIGLLTYVIRTWGGYPDAIAFAVLLGNLCAPTIDHYVRDKVFGQ